MRRILAAFLVIAAVLGIALGLGARTAAHASTHLYYRGAAVTHLYYRG